MRVGADAEAHGGGVGRLADDVVRADVTDDRVLDAVAVDHGRDRSAAHPVPAVVPDVAGRRDDDVRQGLGAQVTAVGLLEGRAGGVQGSVRALQYRPGRPSQSMSRSAFQKTTPPVPHTGTVAGVSWSVR